MAALNWKRLAGAAAVMIFLIGAVSISQNSDDLFSVFGSDTIEYTSNSDFFDGEALVINYIADKSTEEITAYFSQSDLQSETGEEIQESVEVKATEQESRTRYTVEDTNLDPLRGFTPVESDAIGAESNSLEVTNWAKDNCVDFRGNDGVSNKDYQTRSSTNFWGDTVTKVYCLAESNRIGSVGELEASQVIFETTFTVDVEGEQSQTATISNTDVGEGRTARIGDNVILQLNGAFDTGRNSYSTNNEYVIHTSDDEWKIIRRDDYERYVDYMKDDTGLYSRLGDYADGEISEIETIKQVNNYAYGAAEEFSSSPLSAADCTGDFNNGQCEVSYDNELVWPAVSIYVKGGDYITVTKPVGTPSINSVTSEDINEIGGGQVTATVENTGDADGSFSVRVSECSGDFSSNSLVQTETVPAGSSEEFSFWVSFDSSSDTNSEISGSCTVEAENSVADTTTQSVAVTGVQEDKCNSNQAYRDVVNNTEVVRMCTSDGLPGEILEECDGPNDDIGYRDGELQCIEHEDEGGSGGGAGGGSTGDDCKITLIDNPAGENAELWNPFCELSKLADDAVSAAEKGVTALRFAATLFAGYVAWSPIRSLLNKTGAGDENVQTVASLALVAVIGYGVFTLLTVWWIDLIVIAAIIAYLYLKTTIFGAIT